MMKIKQGVTWARRWPVSDPATGDPLDMTGWAAKAQVRVSAADTTVLYEWSTDDGNLDLGNGFLTLSVTPADSLSWDWRRGVYDIFVTNPSNQVALVAEGTAFVDPAVTRS
jgi:hypothetical protein